MSDFAERLAAAMRRFAGQGELSALSRLSGGANMESWAFEWRSAAGSAPYVLRRAPSAAYMEDRPFGHRDEAALVIAARLGGVKAPEVIGVLDDTDGLGTGYIMRRVMAEVAPAKILADPPPTLLADLGRELARIHALPLADIPAAIPRVDTADALAALKARFLGYGGDRPVIALAIRWCEDHLPTPADPVLVHGDYRMGNVMVDADGLAAVLDWELAHLGDAHEDLAFGCMTVWRFGQLDRPALGLGSLEDYFAAYESAGGEPVDHERFRFWLIYRTLWWALGCLQMGEAWRSGADTTVERVVVGRRTAEQELDLVRLLEAEAPDTERARALPQSPLAARVPAGEPTNGEMVRAVRDWIESAIKPQSSGHAKFEAVVAMNALGIVLRDLDAGVRAEDEALADELLAGTATLARPGLLAELRRAVLDKCAVDSPKYAALAAARAEWGG
jgi:aminoglycoside phosphotransferase (APT) family kinase protein